MSGLNQPPGGNAMPRFGGPATMLRLSSADAPAGLGAAFIGVPLDIGTSHRPGARFGPRQIRAESALIRPSNMATGATPLDALQVADLGDVAVNTCSLEKSVALIEAHFDGVAATASLCPFCARRHVAMGRWRWCAAATA